MSILDLIYRAMRPHWRRKHGPAREDALAQLRATHVIPSSPIQCIEMDRMHGYPMFCVLVESFGPEDEIRRAGGVAHQLRCDVQAIVHADERFGSRRGQFDAQEGVWFYASKDEFDEQGRCPDNWWNW